MQLPEMPPRIAKLPRDPRGYPIPWFVADVNGVRDFRVVDQQKMHQAHTLQLCMICGERLGGYLAFTIGPMCAVNRISSEPPSHRDCAVFAAQACPFLTKPHMRRRENDLPADAVPAAGDGIKRNPGVALVWVTRGYVAFKAPRRDGKAGPGVLFRVGDPTELLWFAEGRTATRAEILESIETGLPLLRQSCDAERDVTRVVRAHAALDDAVAKAMTLLPA